MREKPMEEWFLDVPWGRLAMVSWGDPSKAPVLLVHGYVDSAATFIPLVKLLPDTYYYVGFDLPGHGHSDAAPGPPVSYMHFADLIRLIVDHLRWDTFVCIAHSMGYLISSFYNAAFPGRMVKLVSLDGAVGFGIHAMSDYHAVWFEHCYSGCYENYYPAPKPVTYKYEEAIALLMKARSVTEEQAAIFASRCLEPVGDGMHRPRGLFYMSETTSASESDICREETPQETQQFTWDPKVKKIATVQFSFEFLYSVLATQTPTLCVVASENDSIEMLKAFTNRMLSKLRTEMKHYLVLNVEGGHNVHFTHPESFVESVVEFLNRDFVKSKL